MAKNAKINNEESLMSAFDRLMLLAPSGPANFGVLLQKSLRLLLRAML